MEGKGSRPRGAHTHREGEKKFWWPYAKKGKSPPTFALKKEALKCCREVEKKGDCVSIPKKGGKKNAVAEVNADRNSSLGENNLTTLSSLKEGEKELDQSLE